MDTCIMLKLSGNFSTREKNKRSIGMISRGVNISLFVDGLRA